jgi:hypothetical protein
MLNEARWVVECQPLRLDEKLCAASQGHSKEMVAQRLSPLDYARDLAESEAVPA